jgi:hypothetical protein
VGALNELLSARTKEYEIVGTNLKEGEIKEVGANADKIIRQEDNIMLIVSNKEAADKILAYLARVDNNRLVSYISRKETLEEYFIREIRGEENK